MCSCADITFSCPVRCVSSQVTKFSQLFIVYKIAGVQMSATILPSVRLQHCYCKSRVVVKEFLLMSFHLIMWLAIACCTLC